MSDPVKVRRQWQDLWTKTRMVPWEQCFNTCSSYIISYIICIHILCMYVYIYIYIHTRIEYIYIYIYGLYILCVHYVHIMRSGSPSWAEPTNGKARGSPHLRVVVHCEPSIIGLVLLGSLRSPRGHPPSIHDMYEVETEALYCTSTYTLCMYLYLYIYIILSRYIMHLYTHLCDHGLRAFKSRVPKRCLQQVQAVGQ